MSIERVTIGSATLYLGDCREVLPLLAVHDLLLTDPPYGFGQGIVNVGECPAYADSYAWNDAPPDDDLIVLALQAAKQQIVCGGNYFPMLWAKPARGFIVWDKMQCSDKHADAELIWTSFDRNAKLYRYCFSGNRYGWEGNIKGVGRASNRDHPTQKPAELMAAILRDYGQKASTVLDPFMGSGSTGVACVHLGLAFTGIERERRYFDLSCERISRAQAQGQLLPPEGPAMQQQEIDA
jgi:site-specific DNA-methyltransferase (adenine-specific)/modification methylase